MPVVGFFMSSDPFSGIVQELISGYFLFRARRGGRIGAQSTLYLLIGVSALTPYQGEAAHREARHSSIESRQCTGEGGHSGARTHLNKGRAGGEPCKAPAGESGTTQGSLWGVVENRRVAQGCLQLIRGLGF
ncbi:hypothetical protein BESB_022680 [Besnoitia besnoiti]|uniref:Uncharacterized protein n=1 Tax=Besnoitia besnoiti TaxID=94643 RepID=A0A2A9M7A2_BESBE|nr:hypothetical protein BESB_022680 [Besnoitia besnoiti]PFH31776.1 hypothetical protein BESB_022680 [Besnoitia besnoiti]